MPGLFFCGCPSTSSGCPSTSSGLQLVCDNGVGEVASWLHGNFKAVEEILRDDRSGLVVNHVEVPVDFRKHVNDAGPFDVDRDGCFFIL